MKTLTSFIALIFFHFVGIAQKIDSAAIARLPEEQRQAVNNYLLKAKNNKTAGVILCIVGGSLMIAGTAVYINKTSKDEWFDGEDPDYGAGDALIIVGGCVALISIPCFISVRKNREKARAILYGDKGVSLTPNTILPNTQSVGVRLAIPLGK